MGLARRRPGTAKRSALAAAPEASDTTRGLCVAAGTTVGSPPWSDLTCEGRSQMAPSGPDPVLMATAEFSQRLLAMASSLDDIATGDLQLFCSAAELATACRALPETGACMLEPTRQIVGHRWS